MKTGRKDICVLLSLHDRRACAVGCPRRRRRRFEGAHPSLDRPDGDRFDRPSKVQRIDLFTDSEQRDIVNECNPSLISSLCAVAISKRYRGSGKLRYARPCASASLPRLTSASSLRPTSATPPISPP